MKTGDMIDGRYRIIKTLGAGGMGTVFQAEHTLIKRKVAIKILHADLATDKVLIERFMNEAQAAGTLGHPNIVESTDMGFLTSGVPYIVFEYLEGTLLTDEIYRGGGMPVRRVVKIVDQIASALSAAHDANIIHRDLKSDNIFLTEKDGVPDQVKVLDFGIARFLASDESKGAGLGTPEYMAPEQITNPDKVDTRADIYAIGVMMYEMLSGRRPFNNEDEPRQLMHRIVHTPPPPLQRTDVPHGLNVIIFDRLLAKEPRRRFQTMVDLQFALDQFSTNGGQARRSGRISAQRLAFEEDIAPTSVHLPLPAPPQSKQLGAQIDPAVVTGPFAKQGGLAPVPARDTPWPVHSATNTLDTPMPVGQVTLPPVPMAKRPYAMYGVAAAGILVGSLGLVFGLHSSGSKETTTNAPQAIVMPQQATQPQQPLPAAATQAAPEQIEVKLGSDVPGSHVTFRRRVANAPITMTINSTDVVELVEVSAPGYKTTRYWLTFDRATYLTAHLVKGSGLVEASEEDTLVALGEVIMVHDSAPAAAAPTEVAQIEKPVETKTAPIETKAAPMVTVKPATATPTPAPRKIGRSAASEEKAAEAAPAETPTEKAIETKPIEKPVETKATETKSVSAVAAIEAKPDKVNEEPKQEPVKAVEQPTEVVAEPVAPVIDKATVTSVISAHRPEVLKCFSEGKKKNAKMKGTLSLTLQVQPSGKVFHVQVNSTLNSPLVSACVVKAANAWTFPTRSGGDMATVAYPFTIN